MEKKPIPEKWFDERYVELEIFREPIEQKNCIAFFDKQRTRFYIIIRSSEEEDGWLSVGPYPSCDEAYTQMRKKLNLIIKKKKIKLEVMTPNREIKRITGISLNTGELTGMGQGESHSRVFVPSPRIIPHLDTLRAHYAKIEQLELLLERYSIKTMRGKLYMDREDIYNDAIDELLNEYETKLNQAEEEL